MTDAIFALSSGKGKAGVAVVRVSGSGLLDMFCEITNRYRFGVGYPSGVTARHAYLTDLIDSDGGVIDRAIAVYFQAPNSFTGEEVIEFHVHGSQAVIAKLFDVLKSKGARLAEPGEFARRAFDNGKMDLTEIDGLAALLESRTDAQRRSALRSAAGADSAVYMRWRAEMIDIAAFSAAMLDYPADELPANIGETLMARTRLLHDEISGALGRAGKARAVRSGFNIVIVGPVNAGKSSLFNRLVGESRAIVSDIPGTTRDVVSAEIDMDGYLVRLSDTAGLRDTDDTIEKIGIERANAEIENADLVLRVLSDECQTSGDTQSDNEIPVFNKCDLSKGRPSALCISALTGKGIPELLARIKQEVHNRLDGAESEIVVNERAKNLLGDAACELKAAMTNPAPEIFAEYIRAAADAVGKVLGIIGANEVMDSVFGQLCLGK